MKLRLSSQTLAQDYIKTNNYIHKHSHNTTEGGNKETGYLQKHSHNNIKT